MTEERRVAPVPPPDDPGATVPDIAGQAAALEAIPPPRAPAATPSVPSIGDGEAPPPSRTGARDTARRRGRMTLRIPDDEVSRPERESAPPPSVQPPAAPAPPAPPPPPEEPAVMLVPTRIISINPAEPSGPPPPVQLAAIRPPAPADPEDSWTPFQPTVADDAPAPRPVKIAARGPMASEDLIPIHDDLHEDVVIPDEDTSAPDAAPESLEPEDVQPVRSTPTPPRGHVQSEPEGEDIRFDDDVPPLSAAPLTPRMEGAPASAGGSDRMSDPGAEISADDVVAVEPVLPPKAPASLPPMRPRLQSQPPSPVPRRSAQPLPPLKAPLVIVPPHVGTVAPQQAEGSGLRRKGRLWWEDLFNDDYLRTCEKLTEEQIAHEVDFVEDSLGIERGGAVLDLACGTGRHAIELARRGYEVVGFDLSLAMLARAGEDAQDHEARLTFVQGDMREMAFEEQFDGIYCWNTSFGYFEEDKNAQVIDRIHNALKGGGLFLLDVINRDFLIRQSPSLAWFEGDGCVCMDEMSVDFITSRMKIKRTMMLDDGRSREIEYSMRIYSLHELGKILHEHGFKVCEVSGRVATPGVFFGNESPRTIILAERR